MPPMICMVCSGTADCVHYCVESCRACSSFFRRRVIECREIRQRCDGKCDISTSRRGSFVKCRFEKCLDVGMRISAVYRNLRKYGSANLLENVFLSNPLTLLEQIQDAYQKLENDRSSIFINNLDQKKLLKQNFLMKFFLLDSGFKTNGTPVLKLPNGSFMTSDKMHHFYSDEKSLTSQNAIGIMKSYWNLMGITLVADFGQVHIDFQEFLFLIALLYWDYGTQGQSQESVNTCRTMRTRVMKELSNYEKKKEIQHDSSLRVGAVILLLSTIQRTLSLIEESREISLVYNFYDMHYSMYEALSV